MENNSGTNDELRRFLRAGDNSGDDFEREAREGFSRVSEDEAVSMKARLDRRVDAQLNRNRRPSLFYWVAAAAVILIIGFSVMYVRDAPPQTQVLSYDDRSESVEAPPQVQTQINTDQDEEPRNPVISEKKVKRRVESGGEQITADAPSGKQVHEDEALSPPVHLTEENDVTSIPANADEISSHSSAATVGSAPEKVESAPLHKRSDAYARAAVTQAADAGEPVITAAYPGGNDSLCASLKNDIARTIARFSAVLFIDRNGRVKKADITTDYNITPGERRRIGQLLKSISGFSLSADPGPRLTEYRFGCAY